jgi:hypothetical protein
MKLMILTVCLAFYATDLSQAADIFGPSPTATAVSNGLEYPTSAALLSATRSGEVFERLRQDCQENDCLNLGRTVIRILKDESHAPPGLFDDPYRRTAVNPALLCGFLFWTITKYELNGGSDEQLASTFQGDRTKLADAAHNEKFMEAFDSLAKDYAKAIREFVESDRRRQAAAAEKQRQANIEEQREREKKAAEAASEHEEEETRAAAAQEAMEMEAKIRKQKLDEIRASTEYKRWQASQHVEVGVHLLAEGQSILDHDNAVGRESDVVDLAARKRAGEKLVAGKEEVKKWFPIYRDLGGKAATPEDVRAGPDPSKPYW